MPSNDKPAAAGTGQTLPDGTGPGWMHAADEAVRISEARAQDGSLTWTDVLLRQTFAVLELTQPASLHTALTTLAATVTAWVEDIDRKAGK